MFSAVKFVWPEVTGTDGDEVSLKEKEKQKGVNVELRSILKKPIRLQK